MIIDIAEFTPTELFFVILPLSQCQIARARPAVPFLVHYQTNLVSGFWWETHFTSYMHKNVSKEGSDNKIYQMSLLAENLAKFYIFRFLSSSDHIHGTKYI